METSRVKSILVHFTCKKLSVPARLSTSAKVVSLFFFAKENLGTSNPLLDQAQCIYTSSWQLEIVTLIFTCYLSNCLF